MSPTQPYFITVDDFQGYWMPALPLIAYPSPHRHLGGDYRRQPQAPHLLAAAGGDQAGMHAVVACQEQYPVLAS